VTDRPGLSFPLFSSGYPAECQNMAWKYVVIYICDLTNGVDPSVKSWQVPDGGSDFSPGSKLGDLGLPRFGYLSLHYYGTLRYVGWKFVGDVSTRPVGLTFKGSRIQEDCLTVTDFEPRNAICVFHKNQQNTHFLHYLLNLIVVTSTCFDHPSVHPQEQFYMQFRDMVLCIYISSVVDVTMCA
jgi:hypothetical protein